MSILYNIWMYLHILIFIAGYRIINSGYGITRFCIIQFRMHCPKHILESDDLKKVWDIKSITKSWINSTFELGPSVILGFLYCAGDLSISWSIHMKCTPRRALAAGCLPQLLPAVSFPWSLLCIPPSVDMTEDFFLSCCEQETIIVKSFAGEVLLLLNLLSPK